MNGIDERNQNLTSAQKGLPLIQKGLLLWHQHLGHNKFQSIQQIPWCEVMEINFNNFLGQRIPEHCAKDTMCSLPNNSNKEQELTG
jgi:hypothetical protein